MKATYYCFANDKSAEIKADSDKAAAKQFHEDNVFDEDTDIVVCKALSTYRIKYPNFRLVKI